MIGKIKRYLIRFIEDTIKSPLFYEVKFDNDLELKSVKGEEDLVVAVPFRIIVDKKPYLVTRGTITDFMSVPWFGRWLVSRLNEAKEAAVFHDYCYKKHPVTRKEADEIFYWGCRRLGFPEWKSKLVYKAVRLGGFVAWKKKS